MEVGCLQILLSRDRRAYVRWITAAGGEVQDVDLGRLATVAAVDWALRATLASTGFADDEVERLLAGACAAKSASGFARDLGVVEVVQAAPPPATLGGAVHVDVTQPAEGPFRLSWRVPSTPVDAPVDARTLVSAARVLAVAWALAETHGHGGAVRHALYAVRGGYATNGRFTPSSSSELMALLLQFGSARAESDEQAALRRASFRIV